MPVSQQIAIAIQDRSAIGEARRISSRMAERAKLPSAELGRVPLIVTELATNLQVHAQDGEVLLRILPADWGPGLEIIALDRGPGIADLATCMTDGYSRSGTRGCGLGAVRRLSSEFGIYSSQPAGTVVVSRVSSAKSQPSRSAFCAISIPARGETECGDGWHLRQSGDRLAAIVVDGLGHGPLAAAAATSAVTAFGERWFETPSAYLEAADAAMRSTRGGAVAIAQIDLRSTQLHYAGVGNIAGRIESSAGDKPQSMISHGGIAGVKLPKVRQFDYAWRDRDVLVMHSDGLSERWRLGDYPGLMRADVALIAGILYRDANRRRDDATVLVARLRASSQPCRAN
jgi:anti-sigma regulatory factor (Ser/Thr protein kinase)